MEAVACHCRILIPEGVNPISNRPVDLADDCVNRAEGVTMETRVSFCPKFIDRCLPSEEREIAMMIVGGEKKKRLGGCIYMIFIKKFEYNL